MQRSTPHAFGAACGRIGVLLAAVAVFGAIWWRLAPGWWPDLVVRIGPSDEMRVRAAASPRASGSTSIAVRMLFRKVRDGQLDLAAFVHHRDRNVRRLVAFAMGHIDAIANEADLLVLSGDQDASVRASAVRALRAASTDTSASALVSAIRDRDVWVRYHALESCGERRITACADSAVLASRDEQWEIRAVAARTLAAIAAVERRAEVRPLLVDPEKAVRSAAIEALCVLGDDQVDGIIAALDTIDPSARVRFAEFEQSLVLDEDQRTRWRELTRAP